MRNPPGTNPSGRPRVDSCYMGHAYTPDNTRRTTVRVRGKVYVARKCRKCLRANQHRRKWGDPKWDRVVGTG